ncbi:MAG: hypothetical protein R2771_15675 [Saprospiraceae bacterium]
MNIVLLIAGCLLLKDDDLVIIPAKNRDNPPFKLSGYYLVHEKEVYDGCAHKSTYFFYSNGVVLYGGSYYASDSIVFIKLKNIIDQYGLSFFNDSKPGWGSYCENNNKIDFEIWMPSSGGGLKTVIRSGIILNDTCFLINKIFDNYSKKMESANDTFYFQQFCPKPDSINKWVP